MRIKIQHITEHFHGKREEDWSHCATPRTLLCDSVSSVTRPLYEEQVSPSEAHSSVSTKSGKNVQRFI
ncbi:hypothetical protein E2C01_068704 [Portunus trituberculatus]|uniref:Uncharacterized protein n=1 Tax=Portunus trituberculatus TaxID=210409 RepID=A0A5B7HX94_PORTR|nr:hypothetical protein [Portunus trituberculatus]